jgi:hypothetical protein
MRRIPVLETEALKIRCFRDSGRQLRDFGRQAVGVPICVIRSF